MTLDEQVLEYLASYEEFVSGKNFGRTPGVAAQTIVDHVRRKRRSVVRALERWERNGCAKRDASGSWQITSTGLVAVYSFSRAAARS